MIGFRDGSQQEWNQLLAAYPEANFLQSWQWAETHSALGETTFRKVITKDDKPAGLFLAVQKDARRGRYLELAGGPLIDWFDDQIVTSVVAELRRIATTARCVFVRLRPQVYTNPEVIKLLKAQGLKRSPMHVHGDVTSILDITPSQDDLLTNMRQQTRYEVRRAPKREVIVTWDTSTESLEEFITLQTETAYRQQFIASSPSFLRALHTSFGDSLRIYKTMKNGQLLNIALIIMHGNEADYFEAASTPEARKQPGAYAIIWHAILDAKDNGLTRLNLWGITVGDNPNHRFHGVTVFKRGFGGDDVQYVPAHDIVISKIGYAKNVLVETIRKKKRRL